MGKRRRITSASRVVGAVAAFWLASVWPAIAQETQEAATRAEADRKTREAKSRDTQPYRPNGFEKTMRFVEDKGLFILGREGFYPKFGSLTTGSGFAYGGGFRDRDLFDQRGIVDVWVAASLRKYWATEARLTFPRIANGRVLVETWAAHRDYPQEDFFGLGPDSQREAHTSYSINSDRAGARAGVRPFPIMLVGGGAEYLNPRLGPGKDKRVPSIEEVFTPAEAPGLGESVNYLRTNGFVEVDYREPRNARKGGWYQLDLSHFDDRTTGQYSVTRLDIDLRQFVGFLAERRVVAGRLFLSTSDTGPGETMPFYSMPTLGGNDSLRGFREYRFRGPHSILLQGEYRWEIWSAFDAALFYDTGKVANRRADLNFKDLEHDYGIGFRFNTDQGVIMRVDAGFGSQDGKHLYIVFGGVF